MPSVKSARKSVGNRIRNQVTRTMARTSVKHARLALASGSPEEAQTAVLQAISTLDRSVKRGALHPNNAAQRKSALAHQLQALRTREAPPPAPPKRRRAPRRKSP